MTPDRTYTREEMEAAYSAGEDYSSWVWRAGNDEREPPDADAFIDGLG